MDCLFFFKQKTAYEMRISDWSSDVCSSDLREKCGSMVSVAAFIATTALPPIFGAAASWADRPKGYPAVGTASPSAALVFKRSRLVHDILPILPSTSDVCLAQVRQRRMAVFALFFFV